MNYLWSRLVGQNFSLYDLAQAAGFRCGICGGPLDMAATGALGVSVDHIVPVSKGGAHELGNLQPAHSRCNTLKRDQIGFRCPAIGARAPFEQLALL